MDTFADVLHGIIDRVFTGDLAERAHAIIDRASGTRTPQPEPSEADSGPAEPENSADDGYPAES